MRFVVKRPSTMQGQSFFRSWAGRATVFGRVQKFAWRAAQPGSDTRKFREGVLNVRRGWDTDLSDTWQAFVHIQIACLSPKTIACRRNSKYQKRRSLNGAFGCCCQPSQLSSSSPDTSTDAASARIDNWIMVGCPPQKFTLSF